MPEEKVEETTEEVVEETTEEVVEESTEEVVEETPEEETVEEIEETTEEDTAKDDEISKLKRQLKQSQKKLNKPVEKAKKSNSDISRDEVRLMANGMSDEDIDSLKRIQAGAKALGDEISLTEAAKDPAFVALQEKNERDKASDEAGLDASGKSKISKDKPKYHDGQSKEDHKKQWLKDKDSQ